MRTILILAALLPVVVQAQYPAAVPDSQGNALQQSFADAVQWRKDGGQAVFTRATYFSAGVPLATAGFQIRCTGLFTDEDLAFWGVDMTSYPAGSAYRYAVVTVAASQPRTEPPTTQWANSAVGGTCGDIFPAPAGAYPVTVSLAQDPASQATTTGWSFACAKWTGTDCQYTQRMMDGSTQVVACPKLFVMPPGSFSGADIVYVPAVGVAGTNLTPDACLPPAPLAPVP